MNDDREKSDELNGALKNWRVSAVLPPRFQEKVWQRIESVQARRSFRPGELVHRWLESVVVRPAVAMSYVATFLVIGVVAGTWQAQEHKARVGETFERKYVQSVDPYQAPRDRKP